MILPFTKVRPTAQAPTHGSEYAIGLDLYACGSFVIPPGEFGLVQTGIAVAIPDGYYGRVAPRSGLAVKRGIDVLAGVIDSDYRGEIGVVLMNNDNEVFEIMHGDRIAQLILERAAIATPIEVSKLDSTQRGEGGFGSTG